MVSRDIIMYSKIVDKSDLYESIGYMETVNNLPRKMKVYRELLDLSECTNVFISYNEGEQYFCDKIKVLQDFERAFVAVYAPTDSIYKPMKRILNSDRIRNNPITTSIFKDKDDAETWLKERGRLADFMIEYYKKI